VNESSGYFVKVATSPYALAFLSKALPHAVERRPFNEIHLVPLPSAAILDKRMTPPFIGAFKLSGSLSVFLSLFLFHQFIIHHRKWN
jgi:hypothetical protein